MRFRQLVDMFGRNPVLFLGALAFSYLLFFSNKMSGPQVLVKSYQPVRAPDEVVFEPLKDESVNSLPGTTGSGIPFAFRKVLAKYDVIEENAVDHYGAAAAVAKLESECGWDPSSSNLKNPSCTSQFGFDPTSVLLSVSPDEVDIVIPSIRHLHFLEQWKQFFRGFHLILVQDGDPDKFLEVPVWADFELYNRRDIERSLGDRAWVISQADASIRNFGFLASKKKYVFTIDDDCLPALNNEGQKVNVLLEHVLNLKRPSTPHFFNTLYDPYREGADFVRGYPFSLRKGVPTAISHGLWLNAPDYDAPTQLLKPSERNTNYADITLTIPHGVFYPMCSMNVAFDRELIGPAFMQGLMGTGHPWARYDDMFAGWASKTCADHLNVGVKSGAPYIFHNKASNPFTNLKKEYMGLFWQEMLIPFFQTASSKMPKAHTPQQCYRHLSVMLRENFSRVHPYFAKLADAMQTWTWLWDASEAGRLSFSPSRVRKIVTTENIQIVKGPGRVACFTIVRNEPIYLRIWMSYYSKHFDPKDLFVLDNNSYDNSTDVMPQDITLVLAHRIEYFDHAWIIATVQKFVRKLLDAGYSYVLFTEVDEMISPDISKFPQGLREYLAHFKGDSMRPTGYDLFHDPKEDPAPLDLERPVLAQRHRWYRSVGLDKPLLTNKVLSWHAGFHSCEEQVGRDDNLYMIHLKKMDYEYLIKRHTWKAHQNFHKADAKAGLGFHHHFLGKELEDFYFKQSPQPVPEIPDSLGFRHPPIF